MASASFFTILDTVDSTNNYAMAQINSGMAKHGMAWFAIEQTAGKGQRGKLWNSEKGQNIAMSLVLEPEQSQMESPFHISAAMAISCIEFLSLYTDDKLTIKWPNDLYWNDRKAGGILIENKFQGKNWNWAVAGIGININQSVFDSQLKNPVSLKQITGKTFDPVDLAKVLQDKILMQLDLKKSFSDILKLYNLHLYKMNEQVSLKTGSVTIDTYVKGVSADGRLLTRDVEERNFDFGEVEWIL